jgi:FixJ family two-component response regulator
MRAGDETEQATFDVVAVDDDPITRDVLAALFQREGLRIRTYADGDAFLAEAETLRPACLLLDVYLPTRSGLDVLQAIGGATYPAPIIMISAHGDIPLTVAAMKSGAYDFVEKPFEPKALIALVLGAIRTFRQPANGRSRSAAFAGAEALTAREKDVLDQIVGGASSKEAGYHLGISQRTVETHRAKILEKLGARNTAELIRLVLSEGGKLWLASSDRVE